MTDEVGLNSAELAAFGWWFTSGKFQVEWKMQQLFQALSLSGGIENEFEVVEELAMLSKSEPTRAIRCLNLLIKSPKQPWIVAAYESDSREIISAALASEDIEIRSLGEDTVRQLMGQGYLTLREFLPFTLP